MKIQDIAHFKSGV